MPQSKRNTESSEANEAEAAEGNPRSTDTGEGPEFLDDMDQDRAAEEEEPEAGLLPGALAAATELTYQTIARDGLNLRSGPGTQFPVLKTLPLGTAINIISREGDWAQVDEHG